MKTTKHNARRLLKYGITALLAASIIGMAFFALYIWEQHQDKFPEQTIDNSILYNGEDYVLKKNIETFLVLGLDKFEESTSSDSYNNDQQADFLLLLVFDNNAKAVSALQINRDTMALVNILGLNGNKVDSVTKQIALAHTYGNGKAVSCHNVMDAVSKLLHDVKLDHYLSVKMDAVAILNDLVGGVEVTVLEDFAGIDDTLVKGETVRLVGEQALLYVQERKDLADSSNSSRMKRQQQYLESLYNQFLLCVEDDEEFIVDASLKMSDHILSDRSVTQLQDLAEKFTTYEFLGIDTIEGESVLGEKYIEFYPDENSVMDFVIKLFYEPVS